MKRPIFLVLITMTLLYLSPRVTLAIVVDVDISGFAFNPQTVTVTKGDTVRWTNSDATTHTATSTSSPSVWDSGNLRQGQSFFFQFNTAGTYPYFCSIHPYMTGSIIVQAATSVENQILEKDVPKNHILKQNHPNPFNQSTVIAYSIAAVEPIHIILKVYNIRGQEVTELINAVQQAGNYAVKWDGIDAHGEAVVSGIYFYQLKAGNFKQIKRMALLR